MTYKYCPNCGEKFSNSNPAADHYHYCTSCKTGHSIIIFDCMHRPKPDRLAELREKYGKRWPYNGLTFSDFDDMRADINELLDASEAARPKVEPRKYDYLEIMGKLIQEIERMRRD